MLITLLCQASLFEFFGPMENVAVSFQVGPRPDACDVVRLRYSRNALCTPCHCHAYQGESKVFEGW